MTIGDYRKLLKIIGDYLGFIHSDQPNHQMTSSRCDLYSQCGPSTACCVDNTIGGHLLILHIDRSIGTLGDLKSSVKAARALHVAFIYERNAPHLSHLCWWDVSCELLVCYVFWFMQ